MSRKVKFVAMSVCVVTVTASAIAAERARGDGDGKGDSKVAGTNYNATTILTCAGLRGQPAGKSGDCDAGVERKPDGTSWVTITWPDKRPRTYLT